MASRVLRRSASGGSLTAAITLDDIRQIARAQRHCDGPLLPVLHAIQKACGFVPPEAVPLIAEELNLSRAEVHGVLTFYHFFRSTPPGRHVVQLCRAEACQSMQADALAKHAEQALGVGWHATTADGAFSLEPVYCLGNCGCSPAMMIDNVPYGRVSAQRFDEVIAQWRGRR